MQNTIYFPSMFCVVGRLRYDLFTPTKLVVLVVKQSEIREAGKKEHSHWRSVWMDHVTLGPIKAL